MHALLLAAMLLADPVTPPPLPAVAGRWELDENGSRNLPQSIKDLRSWRLEVSANERELTVRFRIRSAFDDVPEAVDTLTYPLDGSERQTTSMIAGIKGPERVPTKVQGWRRANGDLDLVMTRRIPWGDSVANELTTEKWRLWKDGALWIRFHRETPLFTTDYDLRFVRIAE